MAGAIKRLIDEIVAKRAGGNETLARTLRIKLLLKGIDPGKYSEQSDDDPELIRILERMAKEQIAAPTGHREKRS